MPLIRVETHIDAPREAVFDIARNIDLHPQTMAGTQERVIARGVSPLLELGDEATLEARHFGMRHRLTVRITEMTVPDRFVDESVHGVFRKVIHRHEFYEIEPVTCMMIDLFTFEAPLGFIGRLADALFLTAYMQRLLEIHAAGVKKLAEAGASAQPGKVPIGPAE